MCEDNKLETNCSAEISTYNTWDDWGFDSLSKTLSRITIEHLQQTKLHVDLVTKWVWK